MKKSYLWIFLVLGILTSCNFFQKDSYRKINPDLSFQLLAFGDSTGKASVNDYLTVHFLYKTINDSVFYESLTKFKFSADVPDLTIGPVFSLMSEGDSARLKVSTGAFFIETLKTPVPEYLTDQEKIIIDLKILDIQKEKDFNIEKNLFLSWVKEFHLSEEERISNFLNNENIKPEPEESGIYYISLKKGQGQKVQKGKRIKIHYQGRFLNGYFVDDTYKRDAPLDFVFGTEFYIIDGMEEALKKMREGDKALVIIPSELAFGAMGSAGGIIPPFTTMIYELEVLKVY